VGFASLYPPYIKTVKILVISFFKKIISGYLPGFKNLAGFAQTLNIHNSSFIIHHLTRPIFLMKFRLCIQKAFQGGPLLPH
jgi:hypothetical protein